MVLIVTHFPWKIEPVSPCRCHRSVMNNNLRTAHMFSRLGPPQLAKLRGLHCVAGQVEGGACLAWLECRGFWNNTSWLQIDIN